MKTAISEMLIDSTVKPTSLAPFSAASSGDMPVLDVAGDVLQHDDGIVDHEAGGDRQRHQRQIVEAVADQVHRGEGADQRHRYRHDRNQRGAQVPQEGEDHEDHQQHGEHQGALDVAQRGANGGRAVDRQR